MVPLLFSAARRRKSGEMTTPISISCPICQAHFKEAQEAVRADDKEAMLNFIKMDHGHEAPEGTVCMYAILQAKRNDRLSS